MASHAILTGVPDIRLEQVQRLNQTMIVALALISGAAAASSPEIVLMSFPDANNAGKVAESEVDRIIREYLLVAKQIEVGLQRQQQPRSKAQELKQEIALMEEELRAKDELIQTYAGKIRGWEAQLAQHNDDGQAVLLGAKPAAPGTDA